MSIYATLAEIGIKRFGDKAFVHILIQGVPPHIDDVGPAWDFLPPPVDPDGSLMRAVVIVEAGDDKGTPRSAQEYVKPLLAMSGKEYQEIRFRELIFRIEQALDAKYGERPSGIYFRPDGTPRNFYGVPGQD
jgi:hypothetical protein